MNIVRDIAMQRIAAFHDDRFETSCSADGPHRGCKRCFSGPGRAYQP
jgi:hypothetical protein